MFSYYGSKSKIVGCYPEPIYPTIVEPFAGSARYALRYGCTPDVKVILNDLDSTIAGIWRYLIHEATPERIRSLPRLKVGERIDSIPCLTKEEAALMGFSSEIGRSTSSVGAMRKRAMVTGSRAEYDRWESTRKKILERISNEKTPFITPEERDVIGFCSREGITTPAGSDTARSVCSELPKDHPKYNPGVTGMASFVPRATSLVPSIRHWEIRREPYWRLPDVEATWFIDPPYCGPAGRAYRVNAINFEDLAEWCRSRKGQVIVCEGAGADWLPFRNLGTNHNGSAKSLNVEQVWTNLGRNTLFDRLCGADEYYVKERMDV